MDFIYCPLEIKLAGDDDGTLRGYSTITDRAGSAHLIVPVSRSRGTDSNLPRA